MKNFFTSLLSLIAIVTRIELKISFYGTRLFFQNKVGNRSAKYTRYTSTPKSSTPTPRTQVGTNRMEVECRCSKCRLKSVDGVTRKRPY